MSDRVPAEVFPPGAFIADELDARGWSLQDLAQRMGGNSDLNEATISLLIFAPTSGVMVGIQTARQLSSAFGMSAEFFMNLDAMWQGKEKGMRRCE